MCYLGEDYTMTTSIVSIGYNVDNGASINNKEIWTGANPGVRPLNGAGDAIVERLRLLYQTGQRDFQGWNLQGCDLSQLHLAEIDLSNADLTGAMLVATNLQWAHLRGTNLSGANLHKAMLHRSKLRRANLSGANLVAADLRAADLTDAVMTGANWTQADTWGAIAPNGYPIKLSGTGSRF
jgi:uncharacterized protein YjbI with pentapeptide repeats